MAGVMAISHGLRGKSSSRVKCSKAAWQGYVRQRWVRGTQDELRAEFDLTEWEARSVSYGQISQATEDKIFRHKNGGVMLAFDLFLFRFSITCHDLADKLDAEAEFDRLHRESEELARRRVALRLAPDRELGSPPAEVADFAPKRGAE